LRRSSDSSFAHGDLTVQHQHAYPPNMQRFFPDVVVPRTRPRLPQSPSKGWKPCGDLHPYRCHFTPARVYIMRQRVTPLGACQQRPQRYHAAPSRTRYRYHQPALALRRLMRLPTAIAVTPYYTSSGGLGSRVVCNASGQAARRCPRVDRDPPRPCILLPGVRGAIPVR